MDHSIQRPYETDPSRWEALVRRDPAADGDFFYGVLTTLVYCRPACPSRRPRPENVRFFDSWEQAEQAGFRPCKRCRPRSAENRERHADIIVRACRMMDQAEAHIPLKALAAAFGLSPYHFHRLFKQTLGITPKQYAMQGRMTAVKTGLKSGRSVTDVVFDAGFSSGSRFYENTAATLGMTPSEYRKGAEGIRIRVAVAACDLGWVLVGASDRGVCAIDLGDSPEILKRRLRETFPGAEVQDADEALNEWMGQVLVHLEHPQTGLDLPLDIRGTAFQQQVWQALRKVPVGSTVSYGQIAEAIGKPGASRAVARACAANRIAVAIPCHRVVRKNGATGGYRWGVEKKRSLLDREAE